MNKSDVEWDDTYNEKEECIDRIRSEVDDLNSLVDDMILNHRESEEANRLLRNELREELVTYRGEQVSRIALHMATCTLAFLYGWMYASFFGVVQKTNSC